MMQRMKTSYDDEDKEKRKEKYREKGTFGNNEENREMRRRDVDLNGIYI